MAFPQKGKRTDRRLRTCCEYAPNGHGKIVRRQGAGFVRCLLALAARRPPLTWPMSFDFSHLESVGVFSYQVLIIPRGFRV